MTHKIVGSILHVVAVVASASILDNWWIFVAIFCVVLLLFIIILVCFVCVRRNKGDVYRGEFNTKLHCVLNLFLNYLISVSVFYFIELYRICF